MQKTLAKRKSSVLVSDSKIKKEPCVASQVGIFTVYFTRAGVIHSWLLKNNENALFLRVPSSAPNRPWW
jgi:hypothetical protein